MMDLSTKEKEFYESLMAEARANFDPANIDPGIELILKAWESIPDPKMEYQESFEVMNSLSQVYFNLERFDEARKYGETFLQCCPTRSYGEQEFMFAKIEFELGNFDNAKKHFEIAATKSNGRVWKHSGVEKYFKFYKQKKENAAPIDFSEIKNKAETEFQKGNYSKSLDLLFDCLNYDEGLVDAKIQLQKGQCHYELNELDKAADSFTRAYMLEGEQIYSNINSKYFDFLKTKIQIN